MTMNVTVIVTVTVTVTVVVGRHFPSSGAVSCRNLMQCTVAKTIFKSCLWSSIFGSTVFVLSAGAHVMQTRFDFGHGGVDAR